MVPVFVDVHIHTSENPNELDENYDVAKLAENVKKIGGDSASSGGCSHQKI